MEPSAARHPCTGSSVRGGRWPAHHCGTGAEPGLAVNERRHPPVAASVLGGVLVQALLVLAFVVPGHAPEPHDVPVAVAGPPEAAEAVADQVEQRRPGAFEIVNVPDAEEAEQAILDRDAYGALVPADNRLLVATAASRPVAQILEVAFAETGATTTDVR